MTSHLPPNLLALFAPRPPIPYMPPVEKGNLPPYTGIAQFLDLFEDKAAATTAASQGRDPFETKTSRKKKNLRSKLDQHKSKIEEEAKQYDPSKDAKATGDPYRTLFVGKVNFNTTEHKLKREFELYGPVKKVRIVQDQSGKPRGYAFIEYEKERDMKSACKQADGKKIDGKRVLVDQERGRTIRGWKPRRYGGGLGYTRANSEDRDRLRRAERESSRSERDDRERDNHRGDRDYHRDRFGGDRERHGGDRQRDDRDRHNYRGGDRGDRDRGDKRESFGGDRNRSDVKRESFGGDRREDRHGGFDDRRGEKRSRGDGPPSNEFAPPPSYGGDDRRRDRQSNFGPQGSYQQPPQQQQSPFGAPPPPPPHY